MPGIEPRLFECTVSSVHPDTKSLDAKSRAGRIFKSISYLLPYMNAATGGGFDFAPQVGDQCVVASTGAGGFEVVLGFKMPFSSATGEGKGRLSSGKFPAGSMGMRVISEDGTEAKLLALRGGTVIVGSGSLANTIYSPLGEIANIFDSWVMKGPGGFVEWRRKRGSKNVNYDAQYRTKTSKTANGFRVDVHIGEGDTPVRVKVSKKADDGHPPFEVSIDKDGRAEISGNVLKIKAYARLDLEAPALHLNGRPVLPQGDPV